MSVNLSNSFIHPPLSSRCYTLFLKFSSLWLTFVFYWFSILPFCDPLLVHLFSQWLLQHSPNKGNKFLCGIIYNYTIGFLKFTKFSERDKRESLLIEPQQKLFSKMSFLLLLSPFYSIYSLFSHVTLYNVFLFLHLFSFSHICMCRPINNNAKWKCIYIFSHSPIAFTLEKSRFIKEDAHWCFFNAVTKRRDKSKMNVRISLLGNNKVWRRKEVCRDLREDLKLAS